MFDFFQPSHRFAAQTQRLVAEALQGGGDLFDIARTCRGIELDDLDGWEHAWIDLAERTEARAREALATGNKHTAMQNFFHANQYWRMSDVFLTIARNDEKAERFQKSQENFRAAAALSDPPIEVIEVRCGDEVYDGYFCHPQNPEPGKWPAVFFIGGADAFAEEIFFSGRRILERGWAMLLVDTPGRGSSMYVKGIPTRADYEVPGRVCFDYLAGRPEVDADRMALMGISMGGYYAPRVAAFEDRIKALISWCGCYDMLQDLYIFCDHLRPTVQRLLGGVGDAEAREQLKAFTLDGFARNITCPTFITHGAEDRLMDVNGARRLYDAIGATDKALQIYDDPAAGGTGHCSYDKWAHTIPGMLDWLEARI